ncbi:hypothetical protein [Pendulispora albinea]|uniref:Phosphatidate cytidylyltransferase n=1 Tax=Pendulispora albinea TaxID=2741071 RepID=A0ABZ2LMB7_9BACT
MNRSTIPTPIPLVTTVSLFATASLLPGCRAVAGIFKAGVWVGVIVIVALLAILAGAVSLVRK